jgi:hypothetical protein
MSYQPFKDFFPEIAKKETRVITTLDNRYLPRDEYAFFELYCNDRGCDCRRVFLNVVATRKMETVAVIAYGWESKRYYEKWMGSGDPNDTEELKGPCLNLSSPQSELAPALVGTVKNILIKDKAYVERLKRHYKMFRKKIDKPKRITPIKVRESKSIFSPKIGRNLPCPCGSGEKHKKCCWINGPYKKLEASPSKSLHN